MLVFSHDAHLPRRVSLKTAFRFAAYAILMKLIFVWVAEQIDFHGSFPSEKFDELAKRITFIVCSNSVQISFHVFLQFRARFGLRGKTLNPQYANIF